MHAEYPIGPPKFTDAEWIERYEAEIRDIERDLCRLPEAKRANARWRIRYRQDRVRALASLGDTKKRVCPDLPRRLAELRRVA